MTLKYTRLCATSSMAPSVTAPSWRCALYYPPTSTSRSTPVLPTCGLLVRSSAAALRSSMTLGFPWRRNRSVPLRYGFLSCHPGFARSSATNPLVYCPTTARLAVCGHAMPRHRVLALAGHYAKVVSRAAVNGMFRWRCIDDESDAVRAEASAITMSSFAVVKDDDFDRPSARLRSRSAALSASKSCRGSLVISTLPPAGSCCCISSTISILSAMMSPSAIC